MANTTIGTSVAVAIATPDLKIIDGHVTTTSLQVVGSCLGRWCL